MATTIRFMLSGGDRRSIGRVAEVVDLVRNRPGNAAVLVECLYDQDACVCMRAADALEKVSRDPAISLEAHKIDLLNLQAETVQPEVRWHLAVILPRLRLTLAECRKVVETLELHLEDRSSIVKTSAMRGLADLTDQHQWLRPPITDLIRSLARVGTPAMRARGRKLLRNLERVPMKSGNTGHL